MKLGKSLLYTLAIGSMISALVLGTSLLKNQIELKSYTSQVEFTEYENVEVPKISESIENPIDKTQSKKSKKPEKIQVVILKKKNTLIFNDVVTAKSVAQLQVKLLEMSNRMPRKGTIYLVLDTPGGSVSAGSLLIDTIKAIPQKVKTLTVFSASMGFQFVQNFDDRLIIPSGVLMSHRASIRGLGGEINGELDVRLNAIKRRIRYLDTIASKRMGMSLKKYEELIADEYWAHGFEAVSEKAADKMVLARCDKSLSGTNEKSVRTFFGNVKVKLSNCPLITGPLDIKFEFDEDTEVEDSAKVREFFQVRYDNPKKFVKTYIIANDYLKILQE